MVVPGLPCGARVFPRGDERGSSRGRAEAHCGGRSCGAWTPGQTDFSSCGAQTWLPLSMWNLSGPGIKLLSLELQRGFLSTAQTTGEALFLIF